MYAYSLTSDCLSNPEAAPRQVTPGPTNSHSNPPKNMKRLVNQKLSEFDIKKHNKFLSGNSF